MVQKKISWEKWVNPFKSHDDEDDNKFIKKAAITPMGIVPLTVSEDKFNFWVFHTNFNITKDMKSKICAVDGVESAEVYTPYRGRISIGELFDEDDVKIELEKALDCFKKTKNINIEALKKVMEKKYDFWAIGVKNDEEIELFGDKSKEGVEFQLSSGKTFKHLHKSY